MPKIPSFGASGVVTRKKAAEMIACHPRTIDRMIELERLDARKDGRRVLIDRGSVLNYLANLPPVVDVR